MKKTPKRSKAKPANLNGLLDKEVERVRKIADRLPNGRTLLAEFLGIRLSEVSRYFTDGERRRKPAGHILAGMREFARRQEIAKKNTLKPMRFNHTGARA